MRLTEKERRFQVIKDKKRKWEDRNPIKENAEEVTKEKRKKINEILNAAVRQ